MPEPNDPRPTPKPFTEDTVAGEYEIKGEWRRGNEEDVRAAMRDPNVACDLSGRYNPYPMVEPVVRETKFC